MLSSSAEQYFQRVILGNYPGGVMYCGNFGSSGGYKIEESYTFYPEVSFEKIIAAYASLKSDYSAMIKKFEDNPLEYTKSGTKFLTRVQKDANGKISLVRFFKTDLNDFGESLFFEVKDNGVMVEKSTQFPQR